MDGRLGILSGAAFLGILAAGATATGIGPFDTGNAPGDPASDATQTLLTEGTGIATTDNDSTTTSLTNTRDDSDDRRDGDDAEGRDDDGGDDDDGGRSGEDGDDRGDDGGDDSGREHEEDD